MAAGALCTAAQATHREKKVIISPRRAGRKRMYYGREQYQYRIYTRRLCNAATGILDLERKRRFFSERVRDVVVGHDRCRDGERGGDGGGDGRRGEKTSSYCVMDDGRGQACDGGLLGKCGPLRISAITAAAAARAMGWEQATRTRTVMSTGATRRGG
ncbi:hypothetical protein PYCCODRAFT_1256791 [Trametes coccinea BRFM310]|uniref:Uncharacterized protein n=1 Tax=Trametes coccinea (strain BRFM310) TaxID=1353009 RepID=A0A1Y2I9U4_TRAC3|nr:hypothetical protein PYCCODRAFT_1256791 [Trametes coccinea BRFM310]